MRYQKIFRQSYHLTTHNPLLWLFGLVMLGGFNLYLVNVFALASGSDLNKWPVPLATLLDKDWVNIFLTLVVIIATFAIVNLVKITFIVTVHSLIHTDSIEKCSLCFKTKIDLSEFASAARVYFVWWKRVMIASLLTLALTIILSLAVNLLASQSSISIPAVVVNLLFAVIVTSAVGVWNTFTTYFIVFHSLNFRDAARSAIGFIISKARTLAEFIVLICLVYSLAVLVGNAFINVWHHGLAGQTAALLRMAGLLLFIIWLAVSNTFFNLAFILFFDQIVKANLNKEPQPLPQASL